MQKSLQVFAIPLGILYHVQSGMYNELVHVLGFFSKPCYAIAANFRSAKVEFEERIVLSADDRKIIRHLAGVECRR